MTKTKRVKLLIETSRSYGRGLLKGIARYSHLYGPWSFVTEHAFYRRTGRKHLTSSDWQVDGIIAHTDNVNEILKMVSMGIPAVVQGIHQAIEDQPTIISDDYAVGQMGAEYFLEKGFLTYAYCGFRNMYWSERRCRGYCETLAQAGIHAEVFKPRRKQTSEAMETSLLVEWLLSLPKPVALMACNDDRSQDIVKACMEAKLHIPDDVAILGVDNDTIVCELSDLPLSSIVLSNERGGYDAAAVLDQLMLGKQVENDRVLVEPLYVQSRQSTDILAVSNMEVARGLRFIKEHLREKITVNDVVYQMCLPRRTAEKKFRRITGMPINEMIRKERINLIAKLLVESDLTVEKIGENVGFVSTSYMIDVFKKIMGTTPLAYRHSSVTP